MDQAVHKFSGSGARSPTGPIATRRARRAQEGNLIVVTHEHGDHVAGVIRSEARKEIAARPSSLARQVRTLTLYPQMPEIRLTLEAARTTSWSITKVTCLWPPGSADQAAGAHARTPDGLCCGSSRGASTFSSATSPGLSPM